jgi:hypothetical protein
MLNIEYRKIPTTNNHNADLDMGRLKGLARRYCAWKRTTDVNFKLTEDYMEEFFRKTITESMQGGICGGMVCEWAWEYLITDDPVCVPGIKDSAQRQGINMMTVFKRGMMQKDDDIKVGRQKMYDSMGLGLTKVIGHQTMPDTTEKFVDMTKEIATKLQERVPYLLSISPSGGKHAIGLTRLNGRYYVLEPNQGLFGYAGERTFTIQLANHFRQILAVRSAWKLKSISLQAQL